jgi:hypothetical protein
MGDHRKQKLKDLGTDALTEGLRESQIVITKLICIWVHMATANHSLLQLARKKILA